MRKNVLTLLFVFGLWAAISSATPPKGSTITQEELVRNTQELFDAVAIGNQEPWKKYFAEEDIAILSYDMDETETIYGQNLTARYHATDTWMHRQGKWQIVAGQVLRYYEDPAPGKTDIAKFAEYIGTYELAPGIIMTVTAEGDYLYSQRGDRPKEQLFPEAPEIFFRKNVEGRRLFRYADSGKVDALIDRRNNEDVIWKKIK